jgi:hypothetical protein
MSDREPDWQTGRIPGSAEIADRLAITEVVVQHCRGVDRADPAILRSAYWPDATVAYGGFDGNAHAFCDHLPAAIRHYTRTQHTVSNIQIECRGDEALVESYVTAYHYLARPEGADREMTYLGRYLDTMRRRQGYWKIQHRQVVMDWNQNADASAVMNGPPFDGLARGDRHPDDPLYDLLYGRPAP